MGACSGTLVRALLADGLVDELRLSSTRLPADPAPGCSPRKPAPTSLSLAACEPYEDGVVHLTYRPQA
jgi:uracil-DNA glycosylase